MEVQFKRLNEKAVIPAKGSELAGGWDVTCTEINKESDNFVICKLGFALRPPKGYKVTLVTRSGFTKYNWVLNNAPGLGDEDYLGEYQYRFRAIPTGIKFDIKAFKGFGKQLFSKIGDSLSLKYNEFPYKVGDRIGQIYIEEVTPIEFTEVDELKETNRGDGGFGSTGVEDLPIKTKKTRKKKLNN